MNHYETLQVSPKASAQIIEAAWKALMLEHHPDKGGNPKKAARINEAHDVLSDPDKRFAYDQQLLSAKRPVRMPKPPEAEAAYPPAYANMDLEQMARDMMLAGGKAAAEHVIGEISKNPFFKSVLDNINKKKRPG